MKYCDERKDAKYSAEHINKEGAYMLQVTNTKQKKYKQSLIIFSQIDNKYLPVHFSKWAEFEEWADPNLNLGNFKVNE